MDRIQKVICPGRFIFTIHSKKANYNKACKGVFSSTIRRFSVVKRNIMYGCSKSVIHNGCGSLGFV